jgi:hypothetical protein
MKGLCILFLAIISAMLPSSSTESMANQEVVSVSRSVDRDDEVFGRLGVFDVETPADVESAAKAGVKLALTAGYSRGSPLDLALEKYQVGSIDSYPWNRLYQACVDQLTQSHRCSIPTTEQNKIIEDITSYIRARSWDGNTKAYWVLDDYPGGDVKGLLDKIHVAIGAAHGLPAPPALCGFGGFLDRKDEANIDDHVFAQGITNFTSRGCDYIALYVYATGRPNDPSTVDWSMKSLMPRYQSLLRQAGWNSAKNPLVGVVQTFYYGGPSSQSNFVRPRPEDITTQTASYCEFGAVAILGYAWNDSYKGPKVELANDASFVKGLEAGIHQCRKNFWNMH